MNQDNNIILILKTLLEHLEKKKKTLYFRLCVFVCCFRDQNFSLGKRKIQLRKEGKKEGREEEREKRIQGEKKGGREVDGRNINKK